VVAQRGWARRLRFSGRFTKVNRCITEGRRAFIARYARLEDGGECERWLPLLSAIADGEATPAQLMEVRPHLRHCGACRATVRELHATSAPLAALFPVALAPVAADHGHERAAGLFVRLYEAVAGGVHERAASAALKLQAAAEAASAGKLAAIAASAAAIAGGGAVVVDGAASSDPGHAQRTVQRRAAPVPTAQRAAVAPGRSITAAPARRTRVGRPPHREFASADRNVPMTTRHAEFTTASTASSPPAPATVVRSGSPEPSASSREFASEFGG
jgi:hypothetical protein